MRHSIKLLSIAILFVILSSSINNAHSTLYLKAGGFLDGSFARNQINAIQDIKSNIYGGLGIEKTLTIFYLAAEVEYNVNFNLQDFDINSISQSVQFKLMAGLTLGRFKLYSLAMITIGQLYGQIQNFAPGANRDNFSGGVFGGVGASVRLVKFFEIGIEFPVGYQVVKINGNNIEFGSFQPNVFFNVFFKILL